MEGAREAKESWAVIGGGGFVGNAIVEELCKANIDVLSVDLSFPRGIKYSNCKTEVASITDQKAMVECTRGKTVVVNASAVIEGEDRDLIEKVNYLGVMILLEACRTNKVKKFVHISSAGIHFLGTHHLRGVNEDYPTAEGTALTYNSSKAKADAFVLSANDNGGLMTVSLRHTSIYGPNDSGATKEIYKLYRNKKNIKYYIGRNSVMCDHTYIDNVVHSVMLTVKKMGVADGVSGNAFIITNGEPFFFWDFYRYFLAGLGVNNAFSTRIPALIVALMVYLGAVARAVMGLFGINLPVLTEARVSIVTKDRYFDISKARNIIGYEPIVSTKEGLDRCIEYWSNPSAAI